ncbi:MAG TPA: ADOP family duplicated permease [Gemmatimonadaceae bacterium]|nr:ADOP family duplicated permease [Gemmatimonadaceae bacterium]
MSETQWMRRSERWLGMVLRLYPADFREEMGESLVETYRDRCRAALQRGGPLRLGGVWLGALADSLRNGLGERLRPAVAWRRSGNWGRDMERAVRRLVRAPAFTLSMVGTLTVGLGAFAVVYTVVHKVLIAPLPYERPDDLYFVWRDYTWFDLDRGWLGGTDVAALDTAGGVIEGAVGLRRRTVTLTGASRDEPQEIAVMVSTPDLFSLLGVRPVIGRTFAPDEVGPGRRAVMVLGYELWQQRFGGDPGVVGAEIRVDDQPFTVIGVMGPRFHFARHSSLGDPELADAYVTFDYHLAETDPGNGSFAGLIRARPGSSPAAVAAAVGRVGVALDARDFNKRGLRLYPVAVKEDLVAGVRPALLVLGLAGVFLVLVLAVNLAALLLMRAAQRERELAISRALGANPLALAWATLAEGGLLGLMGGVTGALVAVWGTRALVALAPLNLPRRESIAVDWGVAAVVIGVGTVLGLLAGAGPAFWAARARLDALLHNVAVRGGGGHGRMRRAMVVVQVALSLVLLSTGGLVVRSFERLLRADPGFDPAGVLTLRIPVPSSRYPEEAQGNALHDRIQRALAALPGVTAVSATSTLPLTADANQSPVTFPGAPGNTGDRDEDAPLVDVMTARAGYVETMGIPVLAGRAFQEARPTGVREALIDRTLAEHFFPTGSPVGAPLAFGDDTLTVVGVVEQARLYDIHQDGRSQVYVRNEDYTLPTLSWAVRTERPPLSLVPEVRAAIRQVDPQLALADVRSMQQVVDESLRQQRLSAVLIGGFALGALLLAAMGLFGVVSGAVTRRRHELAVRLALGANHGRVLRLVVGEGAVLVALGLLVGVPGIYLAGRALAGMLVGVSPFDAPTLVAVAAGLALVALVACYVPARRVAGIDPARAFREE